MFQGRRRWQDRVQGVSVYLAVDCHSLILVARQLSILLDTINIALSSPPLTPAILRASKAYLFLIPSITTTTREKIIGCVIAQRISTAMAIATLLSAPRPPDHPLPHLHRHSRPALSPPPPSQQTVLWRWTPAPVSSAIPTLCPRRSGSRASSSRRRTAGRAWQASCSRRQRRRSCMAVSSTRVRGRSRSRSRPATEVR
ncbi:hypothetical protein B0H10DRAFT_519845 [Mycena sp. CBHHK59/15]|nr:hypothetical protein B0H10DRAFT_519845 [Mycena sp. CBHHK59/15]